MIGLLNIPRQFGSLWGYFPSQADSQADILLGSFCGNNISGDSGYFVSISKCPSKHRLPSLCLQRSVRFISFSWQWNENVLFVATASNLLVKILRMLLPSPEAWAWVHAIVRYILHPSILYVSLCRSRWDGLVFLYSGIDTFSSPAGGGSQLKYYCACRYGCVDHIKCWDNWYIFQIWVDNVHNKVVFQSSVYFENDELPLNCRMMIILAVAGTTHHHYCRLKR